MFLLLHPAGIYIQKLRVYESGLNYWKGVYIYAIDVFVDERFNVEINLFH